MKRNHAAWLVRINSFGVALLLYAFSGGTGYHASLALAGQKEAQKSTIPAGIKSSDGTDIGITIMGTIVQRKAENNVALIKETKSGKVKALKPGYSCLDTYTVSEISAKYMIIADKTQKLLIYQDKFSGEFSKGGSVSAVAPTGTFSGEAPEFFKEDGFERQSNAINMTASYRDKIVNQDMASILMQATAEPHVENGQVVGFKISQIDSGSVFWKGGLKDDDVITEINGQKLDSVARAIGTLKAMKQESTIEMSVLRKGSPVHFTLKVN